MISVPALELHSRAALGVEAHHRANGPNTGRNYGGKWIIKKNCIGGWCVVGWFECPFYDMRMQSAPNACATLVQVSSESQSVKNNFQLLSVDCKRSLRKQKKEQKLKNSKTAKISTKSNSVQIDICRKHVT